MMVTSITRLTIANERAAAAKPFGSRQDAAQHSSGRDPDHRGHDHDCGTNQQAQNRSTLPLMAGGAASGVGGRVTRRCPTPCGTPPRNEWRAARGGASEIGSRSSHGGQGFGVLWRAGDLVVASSAPQRRLTSVGQIPTRGASSSDSRWLRVGSAGPCPSRLLRRERRFYELFDRQAGNVVAASRLLRAAFDDEHRGDARAPGGDQGPGARR